MNARQIEVHDYYKSQYPEALILYRIPGAFIVLGDDVERASESIPSTKVPEPGIGILPDDFSVMSQLGADGTEIHLIEYRDDSGRYALPDIERLNAEKEMDY